MLTLNETGTLHVIAQVAIALIGFTGIVISLGERARDSWTAEVKLRLYTMLYPSMTALFCSFVPLILVYFITDIETCWRLSNGILGLAHAINLAGFLRGSKVAHITRTQKLNAIFGGCVVLTHFLAAFAILPWQEAIFLFGLLQQLYIGFHNFILLFKPGEKSSG